MSTLKVNNIQTASGGSNSTPEQIEQGRAKVWCRWHTSGGAEDALLIVATANVLMVLDLRL